MYYIAEIIPSHTQDYLADHPDLTQIEIVAGPEPRSHSLQTSIGPFPSVTSAKEAIRTRYGAVRETKPNGKAFEPFSKNAVYVCKPGLLAPLSRAYTENWLRSNLGLKIRAARTHNDIEALSAETINQLAAAKSAPHPDVRSLLYKLHREARHAQNPHAT